ncbi:unnamed protein product [Haemonchus placei]|uniref:Uncharacterized protein n=1 Tax=Haemonchus placei TaxID=6290 RepID=A0A3P8CJD3_HAEPC|nr:unnamed protein product [Haemonchus placei]
MWGSRVGKPSEAQPVARCPFGKVFRSRFPGPYGQATENCEFTGPRSPQNGQARQCHRRLHFLVG